MCDTVVVVGGGRVLFAKNSDRDANEAQLLEWHPRARHEPGSPLQCTYMTIPQVEETAAVLLSRPFWMWGAEMGANEHGVVIGNEAVFTRRRGSRAGLSGMDLLHLVADPSTAFVLETAGREWAVEEVHGVRTLSNALTIPKFAARHSDWLVTRVACGRTRQMRTAALAGDVAGPADLMRLLRDHGVDRDAPRFRWFNGSLDTVCMHGGGGAAHGSVSTASWVSELSPGAVRHWATGTAAPCTAIFKPIRVDEPLDLGPAPTDAADSESLWWRHERLHRAVLRDPSTLLPLFAAERDELEARWLESGPDPAEAFAEGDRRLARWSERVSAVASRDVRPRWARRYWDVRSRRAGLPTEPDSRSRQ
jgi:secernin